MVPGVAALARLSPSMRGALWMLGSAACFGIHGPVVRVLSYQLDPMVISFARSIFLFAIVAPFLMRAGLGSLKTRRPVLMGLRGFCSAMGLILLIYAQAHMPLARVTALTFTAPLFSVLGAALLLRETVGFSRWAATLVGFIGTVIILRPDAGGIELMALAPLGAALFIAASNLIAKTLAADHSANTLIVWVAICSAVITFFPALRVWSWPDAAGFGWLLALGLVTAGAHQCLVRAFAAADASAVMPYDYTRLLFTAAIGWYVFAEEPAVSMWIGAVIIVAATIYNSRFESRS